VRAAKITRTALILLGPALKEQQDFVNSALYDPNMEHVLRNRKIPSVSNN
jgi:precorrin-4/cobalt-precorrin-4 C11-methyltransferase